MKAKIVFIADRSGSMFSVRDDAIGGFNSFIEDQRKVEGEADITLVLFDDQYEVPYSNVDIKEVALLNEDTYQPRGSTALLDAIGTTIVNVGDELKDLSEDQRPDKVIVCIITDGEENSSKEYTKDKIKEMVEHQQEKYNWEFIFLGANMDAISEGMSFGIRAQSCSNYVNDSKGIHVAYASVSNSVRAMRTEK